MKKIILFFLFTYFALFTPKPAFSAESSAPKCPHRYVTLVNPVRGRNLWSDNSLLPLQNQYQASAKYNLPVTWLLQYDALTDGELIAETKNFNSTHEVGVFMEITEKLAYESGVSYDKSVKWSNPGAVFLSGYTQSERRRLIDTVFSEFKNSFGHYPKSIGAWWIDSYSLNYIKDKYGLNSILIVADQKTTDSYGVWGQWWGYPYIPSRYNVLVPATKDSLDVVAIQWAQRDPVLAYGEGSLYSNFSLQANDYIRNGKDTNYFNNLINVYLNCVNSLGQITIGMETGMEAKDFHLEYENQLKLLSAIPEIDFVTMSEFSAAYKDFYKNRNPEVVYIGDWKLDLQERNNKNLDDRISYNSDLVFSDHFIPDKENFLNRRLSELENSNSDKNGSPWFALIFFISFLFAIRKNKLFIWTSITVFLFASWAFIYRSTIFNGWQVFYGPLVNNLVFYQVMISVIGVATLVFLLIKFGFNKLNLFLTLLPLSYAIDGLLLIFRFSKISNGMFIGIEHQYSKVVGLIVGKNTLSIMNTRVDPEVAEAFFRFPLDKLWGDAFAYVFVNPILHLLITFMLYGLALKLGNRMKYLLIIFLCIFFTVYVSSILNKDPSLVLPLQ